MPSRIIKETIIISESLTAISAEAERFFWRLVVKADDFGLYYGDPRILASLCFPQKPPSEQKIRSWLNELVREDILESAFPSSQLSDAGVRVQSSPDPDARMVNMVTRTEKRRNTADRRIGALERQTQQIEDVLAAILDMDSQSKCVLLALYYPFRSYKEAADFLHMAKATIYRQRKTALDSLFATMYKSDSFR